jgi:hypothetical protein
MARAKVKTKATPKATWPAGPAALEAYARYWQGQSHGLIARQLVEKYGAAAATQGLAEARARLIAESVQVYREVIQSPRARLQDRLAAQQWIDLLMDTPKIPTRVVGRTAGRPGKSLEDRRPEGGLERRAVLLMSQKVTTWTWNGKRLEAAQLLAEGELADEAIVAKCGVSRRQLLRWKAVPDFGSKVVELAGEIEAAVRRKGVCRKSHRLAALSDRWERLRWVIAERAEDPDLARVPGGRTGLLVRQQKGLGSGDNFRVVTEYAVDTGLLREIRELEQQAAKECGEWEEKHDHKHRGTGPGGEIEHVHLYIPDNGRDRPDPAAGGPPGSVPGQPG